jgi:MFS family permease
VLNSIGITNPKTQNTINGMLQIYNYFVAIGAAFTVDRIGRRTLLLVGTLGMVLSFIVWTAISAANEQRNFENAGLGIGVVVMIFVFFFFYNIGLNPVPIAYLLEILPFTLRTKGLAIFSLAQFGSSIFNGFVNPIAIKEIGWKYYFVFICLLVTWLLVFWFGYPETRGVSLEEVSAIFDGDEARDGMVNELQTKANGSSHHVEQVAADMV